LAAIAAVACTAPTTRPEPSDSYLVVRNSGGFDAVVYVVSELGATRVRIGTVPANAIKGIELRRANVPLTNVLTLGIHPIGTNTTWTSAGVMLQPGTVPMLDLAIGTGGDCSSCALRVVPTSAAASLRR
jgi:hypothetical protein